MDTWSSGATSLGSTLDHGVRGSGLDPAFERVYRDLVGKLPRQNLLNSLCHAIAEDFELPLVALLRSEADGTLRTEASFGQQVQVPMDGKRREAGNGARPSTPDSAVEALRPVMRAPYGPISPDTFLQDPASDDVCSLSFDTSCGPRVMLFCGSAQSSLFTAGLRERAIRDAAMLSRQLIEDSHRIERQQDLAMVFSLLGQRVFVADADGHVARGIESRGHAQAPPLKARMNDAPRFIWSAIGVRDRLLQDDEARYDADSEAPEPSNAPESRRRHSP